MNECYKCVHRLTIPGNAHTRCNNHQAKVVGDKHGINSGWFRWPLNFDPVWLESCDGFSDKEEDRKPIQKLDLLAEILSLLGLLLFALLCADNLYAQVCLPTDWQYPPELRGCPSIHKREDSQVSFENGYTEHVIQAGDGKCERMTSCNPLEYLFMPQQECWPQFHAPVRKYGTWARTVTNAEITFGVVGACHENTRQDSIAYAQLGPVCMAGDSDTVEVNTTCGFGGVIPGMVSIHTLDPWDPCWNSYMSGIPCWMWNQPIY